MSTTALQQIAAAVNWQLRVNENFDGVSPAALYARNAATTTGLTWGYLGGNFNGVSVSNGTVALTASTTNYVVAHRTTGAVSSATNTTNWLNTSVYLQLYQIVTGASTITSYDDKRQAFGGGGGSGSPGGSSTQIQFNNSGSFTGDSGMVYTLGTQTAGFVNVTLTGLLATAASAVGGAGLRVPHGVAPTSPTNGDLWTTTAGLYARINGATVGPFATAAGSLTNPMTTAGDIIVGGVAGAPARLAAGTAGQVLTMSGGAQVWATPGANTTDKLSVYLNTATNTTAAGWQKTPVDTVSYDTNSIWDSTNKRAIPKKAGYYQVNCRSRTGTAAALVVAVGLNGANVLGVGPDGGTSFLASGGSAMVYCNGSTDYIELFTYAATVRAYTLGAFDTYLQVVGPL